MARSLAVSSNMAQLISIIIPVYNHAQELLACLDSIESQTYRNVEVIIVDGQSKDNTLLIAKSYQLEYQLQVIKSNKKNIAFFSPVTISST